MRDEERKIFNDRIAFGNCSHIFSFRVSGDDSEKIAVNFGDKDIAESLVKLPNYQFVGFAQYALLWSNDRWIQSITNLAIFAAVFVGVSTAIGLVQAILIDQRIRYEGFIRPLYLYPMAISFIVRPPRPIRMAF